MRDIVKGFITNAHVATVGTIIVAGILVFLLGAVPARASETDGTIITGANVGYAWDSVSGYVNFGLPVSTQATGTPNPGGYVHVTDTAVTGYAWDANFGWLNLSPTNGGVTNTSGGVLGGFAWSQSGGWISFVGVTINSSGKFVGTTATSTSYGQLTFDCTFCDVRTDWRPVSARTSTTGTTGGISGSSGGGGVGTPTTVPPGLPASVVTPTSPVPTSAEAATVVAAVPGIGEDTGAVEEGELPEELFDIRLVIDRRTLGSAKELVARTTFESFGRVPTPVDLTFIIKDSTGKEVYTKKDNVVIETEGVLVTRFTDATELPLGEYVLTLRTLYNNDVEDYFEIPFTLTKDVQSPYLWWIVGGVLALAVIGFIFAVARRKRYTCPVSKHVYSSKEDAQQCERWDRAHNNQPNPDITKRAIK